jgi:HSP20 family molecular chaperone IbpA
MPFAILPNLKWSEQMNLIPRLWTTSQELPWDPLRVMRREMENALRAFDQNSLSPDIGAGAPAINVAETKDAFEVTAELPGVDEKDIKVSLDDNQLVISGEKRAESPGAELRLVLPIDVPAIRAGGRSRQRSFRQGRAASHDQKAR